MWPNLQETADLVTFTEENFNGKLDFLCSDISFNPFNKSDSLFEDPNKPDPLLWQNGLWHKVFPREWNWYLFRWPRTEWESISAAFKY